MKIRLVACAAVMLGTLAGASVAEAMPVGFAAPALAVSGGMLGIEKAAVVIRKTTVIKRGNRTTIRKTIIRRP